MKNNLFSGILTFVLAAAIGLFSAAPAFAATPTLSLSNVGGSSVQITVNGDPNASVVLYYPTPGGSGNQSTSLGTTNSSGSFSTTISGSSYSIVSGESVYVIVNSQQSGTQLWPSSTTSGSPVLSQSSVTVGLGQSATITSQNNAAVYLSSNSSPSVASITTNGGQITVTGVSPGSTVASICYTGTSASCTSLSVTSRTGSTASITFSPNNLTLSPNASQAVTISGGNGTYSISSNSNTAVTSANLSGTSITINGIANGNATITVCDTSNACGTLSVTVGTASTSGAVTFGQTNPTVIAGQSLNISLSGGSGYFISSNANAGIVTASVSGSSLVLYGSSAGSDSLTVCASSGGCSTLAVNVTSNSSGGSSGSVTFGTTNPTIVAGQSMNISLSGASSYFVSSNSNASIVQASINGGTLALYGSTAGSDTLTVCASSGGCSTLTVTVTSAATTVTPPAASVVANNALLTEIQSLQNVVTQLMTQMQSVQTQLNQLAAQVSAGSGSTVNTSITAVPTTTTTPAYNFTELLTVGSQDAQVTALQQQLTKLGFYAGAITGFYGTQTETAVIKYQVAHGITATGYIGPSTRTALNAGN